MQLIRQVFKPFYLWMRSPAYRDLLRVRRACRNKSKGTSCSIRVSGYTASSDDGPGMLHQYESIIYNRAYDFDASNEKPLIFCCGVNIGLEILFFKSKFPAARIKAWEADPQIALQLQQNISANKLNDVEAVHAAVWTSSGTLSFAQEGSLGGKSGSGNTTVPSIRLADELRGEEKIDLLIMDIEGAEMPVLRDCRDELHRVERLFVEWHSPAGQKQELPELLQLLTDAGFRYKLCNEPGLSPFQQHDLENGFDAMVEIYAERRSS